MSDPSDKSSEPQPARQSPRFAAAIVTLWRADWNPAQQRLIDWFLREQFPAGALFVWVTVKGSEAERRLIEYWPALAERCAGASLELIATPPLRNTSAREKHEAVASLYNLALERVDSVLALFVEDDVIAMSGAVQDIFARERKLPPETAAIMAAYRSRILPGCVCASDHQGRYLPWPDHRAAGRVECGWLGGGFTLYRKRWIQRFLPFFMEEREGIVSGWDVNLCRQLREAGGRLFVDTAIRAGHHCAEVLDYCRKRGAEIG
jgi:hypothetical protein